MFRTGTMGAAALLVAAACQLASGAPGASERTAPGDSDPEAVKIAESVLESMGGSDRWAATRCLRWRFFGRRLHYWDRRSGDIRIESPASEDGQRPELLVLMNIHTKKGRVWEDGSEVLEPGPLAEQLDLGHQWWVNDSYWMFMPYKLLDPGVTLKYRGERALEDGRTADVLELTFDEGIGYTPQNKYEVDVVRDSGLIERWSFFAEATDPEPRFVLPWEGWQRFGGILLATGHGKGLDWEIAVYDELPRSVFESPEPVAD